MKKELCCPPPASYILPPLTFREGAQRISQCTFIHLGEESHCEKVKCLAQEHITVTWNSRARTYQRPVKQTMESFRDKNKFQKESFADWEMQVIGRACSCLSSNIYTSSVVNWKICFERAYLLFTLSPIGVLIYCIKMPRCHGNGEIIAIQKKPFHLNVPRYSSRVTLPSLFLSNTSRFSCKIEAAHVSFIPQGRQCAKNKQYYYLNSLFLFLIGRKRTVIFF